VTGPEPARVADTPQVASVPAESFAAYCTSWSRAHVPRQLRIVSRHRTRLPRSVSAREAGPTYPPLPKIHHQPPVPKLERADINRVRCAGQHQPQRPCSHVTHIVTPPWAAVTIARLTIRLHIRGMTSRTNRDLHQHRGSCGHQEATKESQAI